MNATAPATPAPLPLARQFLLAPPDRIPAPLAARHPVGPALCLAVAPGLAVTRGVSATAEVLLLGDAIDPDVPEAGNAAVVDALCAATADFAGFEAAAARLTGRWLAFVRTGAGWRAYPDAGGTRALFHARTAEGIVAASQPGLLVAAGLPDADPALTAAYANPANRADSWPLALTPYPGVRQLLPNHCLDLGSGAVARFWPRDPLPDCAPDVAIELARARLAGTVRALAGRGRSALPVTGGYDSRCLVACAGASRAALDFVRLAGHHLPFHDELVPRALGRRLGFRVRTLPTTPVPEAVQAVLAGNTGGLYRDRADYMLGSFGRIAADYLLLGQMSEIARCFYYPDGRHPEPTPELLARLTKFGTTPLAVDAFAGWLAAVPRFAAPQVLDLLYWEHRIGNWAALLALALDGFLQPVFPFNDRVLLAALLGTPVAGRAAPYALHRALCAAAAPAIADVPFNTSWLDRLVDSHWRLRRAVYGFRRRRAGFAAPGG